MAWIDQLLKLAAQKARAIELYEKLPHVSEAFSPKAVAYALDETGPNQLTALRPSEFKQLAYPLSQEQAAPYVSHYADLLKNRAWSEPPEGLFMEHYLEGVRKEPFEGFSSVPYLRYLQDPTSPARGQVTGHEGRHRFLTLDSLFGPDLEWPVRFQGSELPKRPYFVYPESGIGSSVDLSSKPRFAQGGLNQCRCK